MIDMMSQSVDIEQIMSHSVQAKFSLNQLLY